MNRCQVCQKEYKARNYWQKYCSSNCKLAGWAVKKFPTLEDVRKFLTKVKR